MRNEIKKRWKSEKKRKCKICGNVWIHSRLRNEVNYRIRIGLCTDTNANMKNQCFGSGSTCFWASRIRIRILLSSSKNSKKNLDSYCFVTSFELESLKNDVNVPSKSNKL
jgi:hypothetical protein